MERSAKTHPTAQLMGFAAVYDQTKIAEASTIPPTVSTIFLEFQKGKPSNLATT